LGGVNAVTPHWAGAVDIVAVRQQDGSIKSSPFYVRFGKYQTFSKNRKVIVRVNDVDMDFGLELGQYGGALFAHEQEVPATGAL
jgi:phosphatidate phosphatase LPIN